MLFDILKIYFLSSSSLAQKKPPVKDGKKPMTFLFSNFIIQLHIIIVHSNFF